MHNEMDAKYRQRIDTLCSLLGLEVECYGMDNIILLDPVSGRSVKLPFWLVQRIVKLRPALKELDNKNMYENRLSHSFFVDVDYAPHS